MKLGKTTAVALHTLLASERLNALTVLHTGQGTDLITGLKYVTDIDEISVANPDTALFITEGVGLGGWMVSAAIRIAWERKSAALIVPDVSISDSVVELARRLDVTLLATQSTIATVALDFAVVLGAEQAGTLAQVHAFVTKLAKTYSMDEALQLIADELGIERVSLTNDVPLEQGVRVKVPPVHDSHEHFTLQASVPDTRVAYARELLESVAPLVGLLLSLEYAKRQQSAFPLVAITALLGIEQPRTLHRSPPESVLAEFGWRLTHPYAVCYLAAPETCREQILVQQRWERVFPDDHLTRISEGWLAVIPILQPESYARFQQRMRDCLHPFNGMLELRVGISAPAETADQARDAVHQAWLASLFAEPGESVSFESLQLENASRMIPGAEVAQLADYFFPELKHAPHRDELVAAGLAFCNAFGSVARAAEITGVHRNTIQARITKLEQLGVSFSDPERALGTHMLLHAFNQQCHTESETHS